MAGEHAPGQRPGGIFSPTHIVLFAARQDASAMRILLAVALVSCLALLCERTRWEVFRER